MRDADLRFAGPMALPASRLCPVCAQALDVRRYPDLDQAYIDCWVCLLTWEIPAAAAPRAADVALGEGSGSYEPARSSEAQDGPPVRPTGRDPQGGDG